MNSLKNFARKFPILIVVLTILLTYGLIKITDLFPGGPLYLGYCEIFMAIVVFIWTFLFMGKEKVSFKLDGFKYTFRFFLAYLILLTALCSFFVVCIIVMGTIPSDTPIRLLNAFMAGLTVGIVEEFTFRGLVFGGILQKIGNSKKSIILAAVISSILFGLMHIVNSAFAGEISSLDTMLTALLKTCQTGIFGIILAFIYLKTRNIYAVAVIHGLNDLILFILEAFSSAEIDDSYVTGNAGPKIITYSIYILIMIPMLVKGIKEISENEAIPFDDDFEPRAVIYEKKSKKENE